jgi:Rv2258c-like winged HTH domain
MVTGGVVEFDSVEKRFSLPREHGAFLTRGALADNVAVFVQHIGLLGTVDDDIVDCFKKGGGVGYDEFGRFHEVMSEDSGDE